jgi:excisionase family DNA binding protein
MSERLLTIKQVQEKLSVSERTVFNFMERGEITGFKVGRSWRFEESVIDAYIARQRAKGGRENKPEPAIA